MPSWLPKVPSWLRKNALCLSQSALSNFPPYVIKLLTISSAVPLLFKRKTRDDQTSSYMVDVFVISCFQLHFTCVLWQFGWYVADTFASLSSESSGGVVVRAFASHQCGRDSASCVRWMCWFSTLLWLVFPRELRFSPLLTNQDLIWVHFNLIGKWRATLWRC